MLVLLALIKLVGGGRVGREASGTINRTMN